MVILFPFSAIVGQDKAKLALICNAIDPTIGGVLLSGDKGCGKSTIVRAFSQVLPEIKVVDGCPFNCNPENITEMCDECLKKAKKGKLKTKNKKMRVVDLPLSITLDRLVGTIDITRALREGIRALQPGILAEANRNILYIDEVNLLEDYVADILLDSAATGWNLIEREGISLRHPSRFILVGSMNPEEGELRPQLLDRFGMFVSMEASNDPNERVEIVKRVMEFHTDPIAFYEKHKNEDKKVKASIKKARNTYKLVEVDDDLLRLLIETIIRLGIKTHRAEITTMKAARAIAAFEGRRRVREEDIEKAMELTLPHRLKSRPFQTVQPLRFSLEHEVDIDQRNTGSEGLGNSQKNFNSVDVTIDYISEGSDNSKITVARSSRDSRITVVGKPIGIPISYTFPIDSNMRDISLFGTLTSAASNSILRRNFEVREDDVRVNVRIARASKLIAILLDSSGSMASREKMAIAKGIARKIAEISYTRRNLLSLLVFNNNEAKVLVGPTKKYEEVINSIEKIPTGGKTPLPSALFKLLTLARTAKRKNFIVHAILITDGKANVPLFSTVENDIRTLCNSLRKERVNIDIYDTKATVFDFTPSYIPLISEITNARIHRNFEIKEVF